MLTEEEWTELLPYLENQNYAIQSYRKTHNVSLTQACEQVENIACSAYEQLTGYHETNFLALYHHRLSLWGRPCKRCGHLLRPPKASFCASCGHPKALTG